MVIVVRPRVRRIEVHKPDRSIVSLEPGEVLDGGEAVPGWRLPVSDIFP